MKKVPPLVGVSILSAAEILMVWEEPLTFSCDLSTLATLDGKSVVAYPEYNSF
jgi:hypothetical protein